MKIWEIKYSGKRRSRGLVLWGGGYLQHISLVKCRIKKYKKTHPSRVHDIKINNTSCGSFFTCIAVYTYMHKVIIAHNHMNGKLSFLHTLFNSSNRGRVSSKRDLFNVFSATLLPCNHKKTVKNYCAWQIYV